MINDKSDQCKVGIKLQKLVLRIRDVYPGSLFFHSGFLISVSGFNNNKKEEGENFCCLTIFCCHKFQDPYLESYKLESQNSEAVEVIQGQHNSS